MSAIKFLENSRTPAKFCSSDWQIICTRTHTHARMHVTECADCDNPQTALAPVRAEEQGEARVRGVGINPGEPQTAELPRQDLCLKIRGR